MSIASPSLSRLKVLYENAEYTYFHSLPLEHFMEATDHAEQRMITIESFAIIRAERSDIHFFNELLIQYPLGDDDYKPGQVVPDNFVALSAEPLDVDRSYNLPLQPVGPFLTMEYVSQHNKRKDYVENYRKYEFELKVPYYLLFYPHNQALNVYRMEGDRYVGVKPNAAGRLEIPELELEVAVLDNWVRYWFRKELVPLPDELVQALNLVKNQLLVVKDQLEASEEQFQMVQTELNRERQFCEAMEAELAKMKAELDRLRGNQS